MRRLLIMLNCRAVHIDTVSYRDKPALPMEGIKKSEQGRFSTILGMEEFLVVKTAPCNN